MVSLNKIWASPVLGLKLKWQLYNALPMTIILYNGECWTLKEQDIKRLEAFHFRCLRKISRMHRNPGMLNLEIDRASKHEVFKITKVPTIKEMLTEKRLRWFGHLMREDEGDPAKETLRKEIEQRSRWFQSLKKDLEIKGLSVEEAEKRAMNRVAWRKLSSTMFARGITSSRRRRKARQR